MKRPGDTHPDFYTTYTLKIQFQSNFNDFGYFFWIGNQTETSNNNASYHG